MKKSEVVAVLSLLISALVTGCEYYNHSLVAVIEKNIQGVAGDGYEVRTTSVRRPNGMVVIPPAAELPEPGSLVAVRLLNPYQFALNLSLEGTHREKITLEQTASEEVLLRIADAAVGDEFTLTLQITDIDGPHTPTQYPLPLIACYSFNTMLRELQVSEGTVVAVADSTAYRVSVGYPVQDLAITGIPEDVHAVIGGGIRKGLVVGDNPPVSLTVTAQNGVTTKFYTVMVVRRQNDAKDITAFYFPQGAVSMDGTDITVLVPFGTVLTHVEPAVHHTGARYSPEGPQDFTQPVEYTVTADDGSIRKYTVTVVPGGQPVISIYFSGLSGSDETERLEDPLLWSENTLLSIVVGGSFAGYQWVLDGNPMDAAGAILTRNARDFAPGPHRITSKLITEAGEVFSSKTVEFIVVQ